MKTRNLILSVVAVLCGLAFASCQREEVFEHEKVVEGLPVGGLSFTVTAPMEEASPMTKASDVVETNVKNLAIILFRKNGADTAAVFTNGAVTLVSSDPSTNYIYSVEFTAKQLADRGITSGEYYMYAVANYTKTFMGYDIESLNGKSKEFVDNLCLTKGNTDLDISEDAVFMTGKYCQADESESEYDKHSSHTYGSSNYDGSVTLTGESDATGGVNDLKGYIHLRRIVSKITFNFTSDVENGYFKPTSYSIYKYSRSCTFMEREGFNDSDPGNLTYAGGGEFASAEGRKDITYSNSTDGSFFFYMPENVQVPTEEAKDSLTREGYNGRERAVSSLFKFAPENATYVVIKGDYKDSKYSGTVEYTIHLGDFSNGNPDGGSAKSGVGSYSNFTVRRNYKYTYNVTVKGIDKILIDLTPGGHAELVENKNVTTVDSHYEQVLISFPTSDLSNINNYTLFVNTPLTGGSLSDNHTGTESLKDSDIDWIEFGVPASSSTFAGYDPSEVTDVYTLIDELKYYNTNKSQMPNSHFLVDGDNIYITAYVNEYYYDNQSLSTFVGAANRVMTLSVGSTTLTTGNSSTVSTGILFSISQESIDCVENLTLDNPFGVENTEETTPNTNYSSDYTTNGDQTYGWSNFVNILKTGSIASAITLGTTEWETVVDVANNGHFPSSTTAAAMNSSYDYGLYQCMSRNRDENGNGKIDEAEIKWYLPSYDQYCILFIGENDIKNPLYLANAESNLYYTSSKAQMQICWAGQGITSGYYNNYTRTYYSKIHVRCARSLVRYSEKNTDIGTVSNKIISVNGLSTNVMRTSKELEEYPEHVQRDPGDAITYQFEVAENDVESGLTASDTLMKRINSSNVCSGRYSQNGDGEGWRVPSLKELYMMDKLGCIESGTSYFARTKFSNDKPAAEVTNYFAYNGSSDYQYIYTFVVTDGTPPTSVSVRCVRDVSNTPSTSTANFYVPTTLVTLDAGQTEGQLSVVADSDVTWTVTTPSASGVTVSLSENGTYSNSVSGTGTKYVYVKNAANESDSDITSTITVSTTAAVATSSYSVKFVHEHTSLQTYIWKTTGEYTISAGGSKTLTLSTLNDNLIKSITVMDAYRGSNSGTTTMSVTVGSTSAKCNDSSSVTLNGSSTDYQFDVSSVNGTITITFKNSSPRKSSTVSCGNVKIEYYD